jgi:hypothetical protein
MKKMAKVLRNPYSAHFLETPTSEHSSRIFWRPVLEKDADLRTNNPSAEEARRLEVFLYYVDQNFEHQLKIQYANCVQFMI